jgi:hypothetical protein
VKSRKPIDPLRGHNFKAFNARFREVLTKRGLAAEVRGATEQAELNQRKAKKGTK